MCAKCHLQFTENSRHRHSLLTQSVPSRVNYNFSPVFANASRVITTKGTPLITTHTLERDTSQGWTGLNVPDRIGPKLAVEIINLTTGARNDIRGLPGIFLTPEPKPHQMTTVIVVIDKAPPSMEKCEVVDQLDVAALELHRELVLFGREVDHVEGFRLDFGHGRHTGHVGREPGTGQGTAGVDETGPVGGEVVHQGTSVIVAMVKSKVERHDIVSDHCLENRGGKRIEREGESIVRSRAS